MSYSAYIGRRLRHSGLIRLMLEVLAKVGFNLRPFVLFREGIFDPTPQDLIAGLEGYEVKYLDANDMTSIADLAELPGRNISGNDLRQRFLAGNKCIAVTKNGEMAAFIWCDLTHCTFQGYPFAVKSNEAYLFDAYTFLSFRGKGLAPCVRYRLYMDLARLGRDTCYSMSDRLNRPSLKFKEKLKAQKLVSGVYIVLFFRWHFSLFLKQHASHVPQSGVNVQRK
jgi:hypothetical protein